jgi:hypothetical protein
MLQFLALVQQVFLGLLNRKKYLVHAIFYNMYIPSLSPLLLSHYYNNKKIPAQLAGF